MDFKNITDLLIANNNDAISVIEDSDVIMVTAEHLLGIAKDLKDNKDLTFDYLSCVTGYDNGVAETLGVAYNFYSTSKKHSLEIRIEVSRENPEIPSIEKIWKTADWM